MSYQPGSIGIAEGTALLAVLTVGRVFLSTPVAMLELGAGLAWLVAFIASMATLLTAYLFIIYVNKRIPGDMIDISQFLLGSTGAWLIALVYIGIFLFNATSLLRQFTEDTLLTALPFMDWHQALIVFALVASLTIYGGIEGLARAAYIITPYAISAFAVLFALLIPAFNVHNLLPWQGTGLGRVLKEGLTHGGMNTGAMMLAIMAPVLQNVGTVRTATVLGIALSGTLRSILILVFTMVFGVQVGREKVIPFYELARLVYLSRFIQHIEALFIILWVMIGVMSIAASLYICLYLIVRLLKLSAMQPIIPVVTIIMVELAQFQPDAISVVELDKQAIGSWLNIGVYAIPLLLILITFLKRKRGKVACATDV